ncbi:pyridoxal phosphate enzyme (YggS family) [Parabacteroides sp. PF5-5]|uniref:YggS family pyridoxal phosphate-dependent enzyme n=1 Tax=unclassified Parabacteroides TaxID=2649774 RepID=UPI002475201E|nr:MULTISPECIES: YggS family pyridoxal phosphate-dependent enzyme [unclassified Parabacteroides]MDH6305833.1 pyridoxal phosphate enzyme (YggS family) [Parabacteroides sp. PH5-39]MDH6317353.1 pyridoxal phosphate enzyme (YggS family) [Parabacteroides sp. PF5-13]MDH6320561.1 pyridoxal phosphate enzyme (YggS family) [Parabacteroides sp. PH5-13]MDH6324276.1 pyridoxal phosphate enzyme (YggS family) [Parabacteroides sp. PH5-8]MDH6328473.1 pyridoxal phosphate enzyme (YggS family) [Parabacteroides sp. 
MSVGSKIESLKKTLPDHVKLVAVSKFHPADAIMEAYQAGQLVFGESRAQELKAKQNELPKDIEWHFIGPLQSNKVKDIAPFIYMIHSIDSLKLLQEVNKYAAKQNRTIRVLLEIHIAREENKHGFSPEEVRELLAKDMLSGLNNVSICGLMGMATFTEDKVQVQNEFRSLKSLFNELKTSYFRANEQFCQLSMGMTDDYELAIAEGSTMVRIGSYIFGSR